MSVTVLFSFICIRSEVFGELPTDNKIDVQVFTRKCNKGGITGHHDIIMQALKFSNIIVSCVKKVAGFQALK